MQPLMGLGLIILGGFLALSAEVPPEFVWLKQVTSGHMLMLGGLIIGQYKEK